MNRPRRQLEADRIDLELHRLACSADREEWPEVALASYCQRPHPAG